MRETDRERDGRTVGQKGEKAGVPVSGTKTAGIELSRGAGWILRELLPRAG